jgi:signal transduction histidine kinase
MKNRIAIKIASIYFVLGFLWILFSDQTILLLGGDANTVTILQTYKGWFYISVTAILLFFLIRNEMKRKNLIEENLIRAKQKAEEADQLKSAFLANMSHEIRTPLNGILGFCELITDDSFSQEEKKIFAANLTRNGNDLLKLITDIMDISKIRENQLQINRKKFSLNTLLRTIFDEYQQSEFPAAPSKIALKLVCGKDSTETEIYSDPVQIAHVFRNLIDNAFFFTTEGLIQFGFIESENGIQLFVEDTGCGIEECNRDEIFKPFFKGKTPIVGNKGFGLGLAISKGLVKLLGSDLKFRSEINKGSRFYFTIDNQYIFRQTFFLN